MGMVLDRFCEVCGDFFQTTSPYEERCGVCGDYVERDYREENCIECGKLSIHASDDGFCSEKCYNNHVN